MKAEGPEVIPASGAVLNQEPVVSLLFLAAHHHWAFPQACLLGLSIPNDLSVTAALYLGSELRQA